jgi:hypothetical protein
MKIDAEMYKRCPVSPYEGEAKKIAVQRTQRDVYTKTENKLLKMSLVVLRFLVCWIPAGRWPQGLKQMMWF